MESEKSNNHTKELKKRLFRQQPRAWDKLDPSEKVALSDYCDGYLNFLNRCRTERQAIEYLIAKGSDAGFVPLSGALEHGAKVFRQLRGKVLAMAVKGTVPLTEGLRLIASHIDTPRLDLKPNPLYEDSGLALAKTQYYGGIKKYHWVARSLAICGTIIRADGERIEIQFGLDPAEPILTIADLLPHLSRKMMEQKASDFLPGENLNVILGSTPYPDEDADERVKLAIMKLLEDKYGINEEDFASAELQIVPAEPARYAGLDASLVAGYGQDDRVCAHASFSALLATERPQHTSVAIFFDKEEVGSEGNTGAQSRFLETFLLDLLEGSGLTPSLSNLNKVFLNGKALSADVTAAIDPNYADVFEKKNNARLGGGINITKYTGHGGKYMASDANAEYVGWVRKLLKDNGIVWQSAALGKVDEGGGGTVAKYLAKTGLEIVDCGPPILGMHSPLELIAREDIWMCYRAFSLFYGNRSGRV